VLALCVLFATAGCSIATPPPSDEKSPPRTAGPAKTDTPTELATPTATPVPNPWETQVVHVAVDDARVEAYDGEAVIRDAIKYWNGEGAEYATYPVMFKITEYGNPETDIIVRYSDQIDTCGTESDDVLLGCAPRLTAESPVSDIELVEIETGYTRETTLQTAKHELGHVVGLEHGDEPMPTMAAYGENVRRPPVPNVSEREHKFNTGEIAVYTSGGYTDEVQTIVDHLNGSDNTPDPEMNYTATQNRSEAEFIVRTVDNPGCDLPDGTGSCSYPYVIDYDGQGEGDWYSYVEIELSRVDSEAIAWHIGTWVTEYVYGEPIEPFTPDASRWERKNWDE
jgi:hypothetical protein